MMSAGTYVSNDQIVRAIDRMNDEPFSTRKLAQTLIEAEGVTASAATDVAGRIMQKLRMAGVVKNVDRLWYLLPDAARKLEDI